MRQRLALIGEQQNDIAGLGLDLAQLQPQAHAVDSLRVLPVLQRVPGPSPAETPFLRSTLESCEREIVTRVALGDSRQGGQASSSADPQPAPTEAAPRREARLQP